jgi:citrate lyase synthetase
MSKEPGGIANGSAVASRRSRRGLQTLRSALGIDPRFGGDGPPLRSHAQHNAQMRVRLPTVGIRVEEIARLQIGGSAVSASRVRQAFARGLWRVALPWIPRSTAGHLAHRLGGDDEGAARTDTRSLRR